MVILYILGIGSSRLLSGLRVVANVLVSGHVYLDVPIGDKVLCLFHFPLHNLVSVAFRS